MQAALEGPISLTTPQAPPDPTIALLTAGLGLVLVWISVVDIRSYRVPDWISLPLIACGLVVAWLVSRQPLGVHLAGAAAGFAVLALTGEVYFRWRGREGLGLGDAKLFAAAGAWMGWPVLPAILLEASLIGLVIAAALAATGRHWREMRIPLAPALSLAFWITWIAGAPGVPILWR